MVDNGSGVYQIYVINSLINEVDELYDSFHTWCECVFNLIDNDSG